MSDLCRKSASPDLRCAGDVVWKLRAARGREEGEDEEDGAGEGEAVGVRSGRRDDDAGRASRHVQNDDAIVRAGVCRRRGRRVWWVWKAGGRGLGE
jgi:hypothetical protein